MKSVRRIGFVIGLILFLAWVYNLMRLGGTTVEKTLQIDFKINIFFSVFNILGSIAWMYGVCKTSYKNKMRFILLSTIWIFINLVIIIIFGIKILNSGGIGRNPDMTSVAIFALGIYALLFVIAISIFNSMERNDQLPRRVKTFDVVRPYQPRMYVRRPIQKRKRRDFDGGYGDDGGTNDYENRTFDDFDQKGDDFFAVSVPDDSYSHDRHKTPHVTHSHNNYDPSLSYHCHGYETHHNGYNSHSHHSHGHHSNDWHSSPSYHSHSHHTHSTPSHSASHQDTHTSPHGTHTTSHDTHTSSNDTNTTSTATATDCGGGGGGGADTTITTSCD